MESAESVDVPPSVKGVYRTILSRLWGGEWISSKELLRLTGQAEFARRIRELRGEFGYPIEQKVRDGDYHYRLTARIPMFPTRRRPYFTEAQKKRIVEISGERCNVCKRVLAEQSRVRLMWDHRIPFDRGGDTVPENAQLLCVECNNLKRQACGNCEKTDCSLCLFCNPERASYISVVEFDDKTWKLLEERAGREKTELSDLVAKIVRSYLL